MIICKECGTPNVEGANYCNNCGKQLYVVDEIIQEYKFRNKNRRIKNTKFRDLYEYIDDTPVYKENKQRYTAARLKGRTRRLFDGYKMVKKIKFDNDAVFSLLRDWIDNYSTKTNEVDKLDDIVRMYFDNDKDLEEE